MKILQINTVYKNGGSTGRIVYDLSNAVRQSGNESYVAFGYEYSATNDADTYKIESVPRLKLSILETRIGARHGFYNRRETLKLLQWMDKIKPDVIHLHNLHNHYLHVGLLFEYIKKQNIPVVWTLHDCWPFTGWCAYFETAGCEKWEKKCCHCPNRHDYPYTWFLDRSERNYTEKRAAFTGVKNLTLAAPSEWLKGLAGRSFLQEYPVRVIRNGIDLSVFRPAESNFRKKYGIENKKIVLGVANGFAKRKGIDYLIKLPELLPENYKLVLAGVAEKDKRRFSQNALLIGRTDNASKLAEIYSAADVFVNPTLEDNYPTTNLESIACGTPVVTFATGGSPESVAKNCGVALEDKSLRNLAENILIVAESGYDYKSSCRKYAEDHFSKADCFENYLQLYQKIYRKGRSPL